jgi:hypothetical protein
MVVSLQMLPQVKRIRTSTLDVLEDVPFADGGGIYVDIMSGNKQPKDSIGVHVPFRAMITRTPDQLKCVVSAARSRSGIRRAVRYRPFPRCPPISEDRLFLSVSIHLSSSQRYCTKGWYR